MPTFEISTKMLKKLILDFTNLQLLAIIKFGSSDSGDAETLMARWSSG